MTEEVVKKKRGRKPKNATEETKQTSEASQPTIADDNIQLSIVDSGDAAAAPPAKKRGRKPKGGKLISKEPENKVNIESSSNVILHLRCSMADLRDGQFDKSNIISYNPDVPPEILSYELNTKNNFSNYEDAEATQHYAYSATNDKADTTSNVCPKCNIVSESNDATDNTNMKDVNMKLKNLKINLYKNTFHDKKSACFWCTYDFDNPPCYIPKTELDDEIHGYGSFCRPECAVAFLMKENIDDSMKFERYSLLNSIYGNVYEFKNNIKPAPNPYYLLEKFYGNLSIQEYRRLLKSEHLLLVLDKPMTRVLPELYEDTDNFVMNVYGNSGTQSANSSSQSGGGQYKVKRQSEKKEGPSKNSIIQASFGLSG